MYVIFCYREFVTPLFSDERMRCLSLMWFWMLRIDQKLSALREAAAL